MSLDLSEVATPTLERLVERAAQGRLSAALSTFELQGAGLSELVPFIEPLQSLSVQGIRLIAEALLAERRRRAVVEPELVWTGPEGKTSSARDTAVVLRELFASAQESVLIAGFRFDHGATLLEPLHAAMKTRGVRCWMFADGEQASTLIAKEWPFGPPFPDIFADARGEMFTSLHAKCVVVDCARAFVTSANFTDRGQRRNVEVGVLLHDPVFATRLQQQWLALPPSGAFQQQGPAPT